MKKIRKIKEISKRFISSALFLTMLVSLCPVWAEETQAAEPIRIEGEDYFENNFATKITADEKCSNGEYLVLNVADDPPAEDGYYYQKYKVTVPEEGCYNIYYSGLQYGANWASYPGVSVNDGPIMNSALYGVGKGGNSEGMYGTMFSNIGGFKKGENVLTVYCMGQRNQDSRYVMHSDYIDLTPGEWCISRIEAVNDVVVNVYEEDMPVSVSINYSEKVKEKTSVRWEMTDYWDNVIKSGAYEASLDSDCETIEIGQLERGHYTFFAYEESTGKETHTFISVVKPERDRIFSDDSPFGIDGAFAWIVTEQEAYDLLKAERLAGINFNRDRYNQRSTNPERDVFDFDLGNSKKVFDKADELGVNIQATTVYLPKWLTGEDFYLSNDLLTVYNIAKEEGKAFGDSIDLYELWNEPEVDYEINIYETADRFAGVSKAMALGFIDSGTNARVTSAGYTSGIGGILELAIQNDGVEFMDVVNFHNHITAANDKKTNDYTTRQVRTVENALKKYGYYDKEMCLDESGVINQKENGSEISKRQQRIRAGYYVTVNAENLANGVDRHFWYVMLNRGSTMNVFTDNGEPYADYNAIATTTDVMGVPEYLGKVDNLTGGAKGYVYNNKNNGKDIMILWSEDDVEYSFTSCTQVDVIDIMGKETQIKPDADGKITLTASHQPIFVRAYDKFDDSVYTPKKKEPERVNKIDRSKITKAQRVLLQQSYPLEVSNGAKTKGYQISETGTDVTLHIANLNEEKMDGVIYGKAFGGWELSNGEIPVSLEPMSQQEIKLRLTPTDKVRYNVKSAVRFTGLFDGEETTNCVTLVQMPKDGEYEWYCEFDEAMDISEWAAEAGKIGGGDIGSKITLENASGGIKFKYDFAPDTPDMWSFPSFRFEEVPDLTMTDGLIIRYQGTKDVTETGLLSRIIVKEESSGASYFTLEGFYMEEGVHEVLIPWDRLVFQTGNDPTFNLEHDNIAQISIGINNIKKIEKVPEYTLLKVGAYVGAINENPYAAIENVYPQNGTYVTDSEGLELKARITENDIGVETDNIRVYIDNFPVKFSVKDGEVIVPIKEKLDDGEHIIEYNWENEDSSAFITEASFWVGKENTFVDVESGHWAEEAINNMLIRGVISGDGDGTFRPDENVTRAELIKMIVAVLNLEYSYDEVGFSDITEQDWFYRFAAVAEAAKLFEGVYGDTFEPDAIVSREDMATFVYRAARAAGVSLSYINNKQTFLDRDEISEYATTPISNLQQAGIVEGMGDRRFSPKTGLTRAEAAKALYELVTR